MSDWLTELKEEKEKAIAHSRTQSSANGAAPLSGEPKLQVEQEQVATLVARLEIEPALQQFSDEVLRDHPLFINPTVTRSVFCRTTDEGAIQETKAPAPWSGDLAGNFLAAPLNVSADRYVTRVEWRLHLNYRFPNSSQLQMNEILVTANAQRVQLSGQSPAELSADAFKAALVSAFREATQPALPHGQRRGRRRRARWHIRLWNSIFPENKPTRLYSALVVCVIFLLVIGLSIVAVNVGTPRLR